MDDELRILSLNCQKGYQFSLWEFLKTTLNSNVYDFMILQEATENVITFIKSNSIQYCILQLKNEKSDSLSHLSIVFRKKFETVDSKLFTFENFLSKNNLTRPEFGLLIGTFRMDKSTLSIGSIHLSSGLNYKRREKELHYSKQRILEYNKTKSLFTLGGDFNSALPWENAINKKLMIPQFVNCSLGSGPTCNSSYVEPVNLLNRLAISLAKFGINFQFKLDHIYLDMITTVLYTTKCILKKNRVSDHNPLEVLIYKRIQ